MPKEPTNSQVAGVLERIADLLEGQEPNPFRVRAYREGAQTIRNLDEPVADLVRKDQTETLRDLPHIGEGIAAVIGEYVSSGKSELLDNLEGKATPESAFGSVPGIGPTFARRIVEQLHIHTLAELEAAAHDGRLARVEGFGPRRVSAVRAAQAGTLSRSAASRRADAGGNKQDQDRPSVELLLAVDRDYRTRAKAGKLQKIAPRRFNPKGEAWLPVLHTKRQGWSFTALYSNTAQAHELGKTNDWVVIYFARDGKERQHTVVTETQGPLKGKRVVRGRDPQNREYYKRARKG